VYTFLVLEKFKVMFMLIVLVILREEKKRMCGYVFLIFLWTSILLSLPCGYNGDKILVFPVDGSHWVNMEVLI